MTTSRRYVKTALGTLMLGALISCAGGPAAQPTRGSSTRLALRAARLLNPASGATHRDIVVLAEGSRIADVLEASRYRVRAGDRLIDKTTGGERAQVHAGSWTLGRHGPFPLACGRRPRLDKPNSRRQTRPMSLVSPDVRPAMHETKRRLLEAGLAMLLERGYGGLGVQDVLDRTNIPKGSFYHHFDSKEDMALQAVDLYTSLGHELLDRCLTPDGRPALARIRNFFEQLAAFYGTQGYLGCLLGALGQELSGTNEVFRRKIEACLESLAVRIVDCLEEARRNDELPIDTDPRQLADVLLNAWEGAALRSRLLRSPEPLKGVLDFCLGALAAR